MGAMDFTKDRGQWRSFIRTHRRQMAGLSPQELMMMIHTSSPRILDVYCSSLLTEITPKHLDIFDIFTDVEMTVCSLTKTLNSTALVFHGWSPIRILIGSFNIPMSFCHPCSCKCVITLIAYTALNIKVNVYSTGYNIKSGYL